MHDPDDRTLLDELLGGAAEPAEPESKPRIRQRRAPSEPGLPAAERQSAGTAGTAGTAGSVRADAGAVRQDSSAVPADAEAVRRSASAWRGVMWVRSGVRPSVTPGCREIGLTTTGFVIFVAVDSIMMYTPFSTPGSTSLLPQALTLALLAFGLGALMIWSIRGACRPVGAGMMLGWVFMTLISAGYFTGLNP